MEISLKNNCGYTLIFKSGNATVEEDVEDRIYATDENGKVIYRWATRDIKTDILEQFTSVLYDLIYYRKSEFDSSDLIERLFEKLPEEKRNDLLLKLNK